VYSIGRCAIRLEPAAERCVIALVTLIKSTEGGQDQARFIIQETIVVIRDIFRKYPENYLQVIGHLCERLDTLNEPEAKAAMIWIIGEYSDRIDNAADLLEDFRTNFLNEPVTVQLALLTAVWKLFLYKPEESSDMVNQLIEQSTKLEDNPDVRDRGFMYWRLTCLDTELARRIINSEKPVIGESDFDHSPEILEALIANLSTLASVYHKPPEYFTPDGKATVLFRRTQRSKAKDSDDSDTDASDNDEAAPDDEKDEKDEKAAPADVQPLGDLTAMFAGVDPDCPPEEGLGNLTGMFAGIDPDCPPEEGSAAVSAPVSAPVSAAAPPSAHQRVALQPSRPKGPVEMKRVKAADLNGLDVYTNFAREGGQAFLVLSFHNRSQAPLTECKIILADCCLGLSHVGPSPQFFEVPVNVAPGKTAITKVPVDIKRMPKENITALQLMIRTNEVKTAKLVERRLMGNFFFQEIGAKHITETTFVDEYRDLHEKQVELEVKLETEPADMVMSLRAKIEAENVLYIAHRTIMSNGQIAYDSCYYSLTLRDVPVLMEMRIRANSNAVVLSARSPQVALAGIALRGIRDVLKA
jgi:AP-1 complex subunit beta-1